jgi:NAD(P)-dependent dehydrogenase (short-subunit alcohol dehydrogenase family)
MGRFGTASDAIGAAVFLVLPAAAFVTRADPVVDGGRVIG